MSKHTFTNGHGRTLRDADSYPAETYVFWRLNELGMLAHLGVPGAKDAYDRLIRMKVAKPYTYR